ncbi:TetR/AcrR family transcriptional regulator [Trujillonella endophytica]|uniref:Transcriptional regulator, TetR family n=1 Tax=Trujillonella endophytica TaxID=673521 RepID=A0A1H8SFB8_9ACTN|nr:TetR/AcrR family transcriptional regulator [Trujillella endophytica]SEO77247.1 transcriptional regulator, TetR family [Trujillella endophytica]
MSITSTAAGPTTREAIAASARTMFAERGFTATSVRAIAAAAGADPALVIRHFGSKEQLFLEVLGPTRAPGPELEGPLAELGRTLVAYVLDPARDAERRAYATMVQASDNEAVRATLRTAARTSFIDRLTARLPGADAAVRAELIGAQIGGLMQAWPTIEPLLGAVGRARAVDLYGASVQALVDGSH